MTAAPQPRCLYCDATAHGSMACPRVKAFEFDTAGVVCRVEFHDSAPEAGKRLIERIDAMTEASRTLAEALRKLNERGFADDEPA
jgi:hypothetical protein